MNKRMQWSDVKKAYPNQWVGFREPEFNDDNTLRTILLIYTGKTKQEMADLQIREADLEGRYTTPEDAEYMSVGVAY